VPMLGRIRLVQDAVAASRGLSIDRVLAMQPRDFFQNESYAWCWALAALLDGHSRYRERFRRLAADVRRQDFNNHFRKSFSDDWANLQIDWQIFLAGLEHGYDFDRMQFEPTPGIPLSADGATVSVRADRGWQDTGISLRAGETYELTARGRFQIAKTSKIWWCEPQGVSVRYYQGQPLGKLLAAVVHVPEESPAEPRLSAGVAIGRNGRIRPSLPGTLILRVNDSAAELSDNKGTTEVSVVRVNGPAS